MATGDAEWATWCGGFDQAENGIRRVFFQRYVFFTMNHMIGEAGPASGISSEM